MKQMLVLNMRKHSLVKRLQVSNAMAEHWLVGLPSPLEHAKIIHGWDESHSACLRRLSGVMLGVHAWTEDWIHTDDIIVD